MTTNQNTRRNVNCFISYAHADIKLKEDMIKRLEKHFKRSPKYRYSQWSDRAINVGDKWFEEIQKALKASDLGLLLISLDFLNSEFIAREELPYILHEEQIDGHLRNVIPVGLRNVDLSGSHDLAGLEAYQIFRHDQKFYEECRGIEKDRFVKNLFVQIERKLDESVIHTEFHSPSDGSPNWKSIPFPSSRLKGGCRYFKGRTRELKRIDRACAFGVVDADKRKRNVVFVTAWGGMGKTTLVREWLARMAKAGWKGADCMFDWSFYRQGSIDNVLTTSDDFFDTAMRWFGELAPERFIGRAKGERLAALVTSQKTIFVLDGLEPLQQSDGTLRDEALVAFIGSLVNYNPGICIITSRLSLPEFSQHEKHACESIIISNMGHKDGVALLKKLGVTTGSTSAFEAAVNEVNGHVLALTLLGRYLAVVCDGDITKRQRGIIMQTQDAEVRHVKQIMESYQELLKNKAEADILHVFGLFNGPITMATLNVVIEQPEIVGLTSNIYLLSDDQVKYAISNVRNLDLLYPRDDDQPDVIDCHPLVREYFASKLRSENPIAWKEGNLRLYDYYKTIPVDDFPTTLSDMMPLYRAVSHGCKAGLHQQVMDEVFWKRIRQGDKHISTQILGAYGADLEALSFFFDSAWTKPAAGLSDHWKGVVLIWAGELLRALGRVNDALEPMKFSLKAAVELDEFGDAAGRAEILSDLLLKLGRISEAEEYGRMSIDFADQNLDANSWQKELSCSTLANVLHQAGKIADADYYFSELSFIRQQRPNSERYTYSVDNYRLCDLLLTEGKLSEAEEKSLQSLATHKSTHWPLGVALDCISLSRVNINKSHGGPSGSAEQNRLSLLEEAQRYIDIAVQELLKAGTQHELPLGLLVRSAVYRERGEFLGAWHDLRKAQEIADWGEMLLYLVDIHVETARLLLAVEDARSKSNLISSVDAFIHEYMKQSKNTNGERFVSFRENITSHIDAANQIINLTGYRRRSRDIVEIEEIFKQRYDTL
jgi:hypothetical protein